MSNPRRRNLQLSIQHVGQETLIYDDQTHNAFCLNPVAAAVWNRCDGVNGTASIAESAALALKLPVTEELVRLSLADLRRDGLLEADSEVMPAMLSRRDALAQLGSRAALLLPVVAVIAAPPAAQAYSGCVNCSTAQPATPANKNTDIFSTP